MVFRAGIIKAMNDKSALEAQKSMRTRSQQWMAANFYPQWVQVYKSYKCEADPKMDDNDDSKIDPTQTAIGMPDTWTVVNRQVARVTAQPPNLRFVGDDKARAQRISRKLMRDWDKGEIQKTQKKHVRQACLFGWSVRSWSWGVISRNRKYRIDPFSASEEDRALIGSQYSSFLKKAAGRFGYQPDSNELMTELVGEYGTGTADNPLVSVSKRFVQYEGPRAEFMFVGDCFPEPNFDNIQASKWFIVRRRRDLAWMKKMSKAYPELAAGFNELVEKFPGGTPFYSRRGENEAEDLFTSLLGAIGRSEDLGSDTGYGQKEGEGEDWTIWETHYPGEAPRITYVGEMDTMIGEINYPYDLDGKIAFTELVLIDDILSGVGDSSARIIRGLQALHDRNVTTRDDLVYAVLRPLVGTSNRQLWENPEMLKRKSGLRLVLLQGPGDVFPVNTDQGISAAAAALQEDESIQRMIQMATGESNMTMMANVDPQQNRTATGARLMAFNQDVLTKDQVDMLAMVTNDDATMMYLLNRSEMTEPVTFDPSKYSRLQAGQQQPMPGGPPVPGQPPQPESEPMTVTPQDFQEDGDVEAEIGSTLADDDDAKLSQAQNLYAAAVGNPAVWNVQTARDNLLIAYGQRNRLQEWAAPPPPPPPPPEIKESISIAMKFETLPPTVQRAILERSGIIQPGTPIEGIDAPQELQALEAGGGAPAEGGAPPPGGGPPGPLPPGAPPPPLPPPPQSTNGLEAGPASVAAAGGHL